MRPTPLLLLAYNRPEKLRGVVDALRVLKPALVYVVVDGPKAGNPDDAARVQSVRDVVAEIDWTSDVHTRFRESNVGLRRSVVDAVSWVTGEHGQVIVMEDDIVPGPHVIPYLEYMLELYRGDATIAHVSGYNVIPPAELSHPEQLSRRSVYPESYVWATWDRAWKHYDDELRWPGRGDGTALRRITGSRAAAMRWSQNFADARAGRISTWAYRWIASIWSQDAVTVGPNVNLTEYVGHADGTHTFMTPPWDELPLYDGPLGALLVPAGPLDPKAEAWNNRVVFAGTARGVVRGIAISVALSARGAWRRRRAR
ncbi:MAG: hypothetical protein ABIQ01_10890 [Pseudolysinimonas sp.]